MSIVTVYQQINNQGTDTMLGFEPRSRQHDTSVCLPLHHIGKTVAANPKKVPYLVSLGRGSSKTQRYTMSIVVGSRHLYFTTRGLVDSSCERTSKARQVHHRLATVCFMKAVAV